MLASPEREVSPTRFHNSVHNAPSGYWNIGAQSHAPTTSLCGFDASFAAGLLDAAVQATADKRTVALIAYDLPYPGPLHDLRPITSIFGVALVLSPVRTQASLASLDVGSPGERGSLSVMENPILEEMRQGNPAARSLPLLAAIANGTGGVSVALEYLPDMALTVSVSHDRQG